MTKVSSALYVIKKKVEIENLSPSDKNLPTRMEFQSNFRLTLMRAYSKRSPFIFTAALTFETSTCGIELHCYTADSLVFTVTFAIAVTAGQGRPFS